MLAIAAASPALRAADATTAKVDKIFAAWDKTTSPGAALAVIQDGKIVYERGYGMAKLEDGIVNTPDKVFDIGSVSKQFTAACVAMLVRDGKVRVEDDIRKYLPEMPAYEKPVTVGHLLHHTSGLRDYNALLSLAGFRPGSDSPTVEEAVEIIRRQKKLNYTPGEEYSYTNSGFFLLSQIVERVSGKSLNAFAQERIFRPLGMSKTLFQDDHTQIIKDRATGYTQAEVGGGFKIDMSNWDETGDGNVYTTVRDLYLWDQAFYTGALGKDLMDMLQTTGRAQLGQGHRLRLGAHRHGLQGPQGGRARRGLGRIQGGDRALPRAEVLGRHPGQSRFDRSVGAGAPGGRYLSRGGAERAGQGGGQEGRGHRGAEGGARSPGGELGGRRLRPVAGAIDEGGQADGGPGRAEIHARSGRAGEVRCRRDAADVEIEFKAAEKGKAPTARMTVGKSLEFRFAKAAPLKAMGAAEMAGYAGTYVSEELLDAKYVISVDKDTLVLKTRDVARAELKAMAPDKFTVPGYGLNVEFVRGGGGKVTGFTVSVGREHGIALIAGLANGHQADSGILRITQNRIIAPCFGMIFPIARSPCSRSRGGVAMAN